MNWDACLKRYYQLKIVQLCVYCFVHVIMAEFVAILCLIAYLMSRWM